MVEKTLTGRTLSLIEERRNRILEGKVNCIPWGLPRFEEFSPGIEKKKYYIFSANSKIGKTQITDFLTLFNIAKRLVDGVLDVPVKIFYFSLEMTAEEKMLSCFSHILYVYENIRLSPTELKSTSSKKILDESVLETLKKYKKYFDKIEEIVIFIDDVRTGYGMFNMVRDYMESNGTVYYKELTLTKKDQFGNNVEYVQKVRDYYKPNNEEEYVLMIIDHISLISTESRNKIRLDLRESIGILSSDYLVRLRNIYSVTPIVIQQQASSQESVENKKSNKLKPSLDGLADNKSTQRDCNVSFGLFSPFRHEIEEYCGYDVRIFKDNIRFLEIMGGREGGAGSNIALYFDGAVNMFEELPRPDDLITMQKVYNKLKQIRTK